MEHITLRGRIISMYGTLGQFAKSLQWSRRKTSEIVNGKQEATVSDIKQMAEALDISDPAELIQFFFS